MLDEDDHVENDGAAGDEGGEAAVVKKGDDDGQKEDGEHGRTHMQNVRGVPNEFPSILWRDMRPNSVTSRKYVFDVTSVGQRSSPWTCNPVKVEVKFHLECKLRSSCAQLMSVVTIDSRTLTGRHCFGSIYCLKEQHERQTASSHVHDFLSTHQRMRIDCNTEIVTSG